MLKNILFTIVSFFYIGCGSSTLNDILGVDENEIRVESSQINDTFAIRLDVNLISTDITKLGLTDIFKVAYILENSEGSKVLNYEASLKSNVITICNQSLFESDGITYTCKTNYSNDLARVNVDEDLTQTIKLFNNESYKVILKENYLKIDEVTTDERESIITTLMIES